MAVQEAQVPYAGLLHRLANSSNSNEERLKMLERRMTGELPSPRSLSFGGQQLRRSPDENPRAPGISLIPYANAASDSEGSDSTSGTEPSNKRPRLSSSPHKHDKAHASPFRQVTNHPKRLSSSTVKRDKHPKHAPPPPAGTPPPGQRPQRPNTINKYFCHRDDSRVGRLPSVHAETQTSVSLQEEQAAMHTRLQAANTAAQQSRSAAVQLYTHV